MLNKAFTGGDKLQAKLREIAKKLDSKATLNVGFLPGAIETKNSIPSASVAYWNEFGGTVPERVSESGDKKIIEKHSTPPRPFFRNMINEGKKHWSKDMAEYMKNYNFNTHATLTSLGEQMVSELKKSIQAPGYAPLKDSTKKRKGNDITLIDSSDMINAVNFEITE